MDWSSGAPAAALVAARAIHFGATALLAGVLLFRAVVAGPAAAKAAAATAFVDRLTRRIAGLALAIALVSGVAWFVAATGEMGGLTVRDALKPDMLGMVLQNTQFGSVASVRLILVLVTAVALAFDRVTFARRASLLTALLLAIGIAWTGHSGSGFGAAGNIQLAADALHLAAASAWIGSLVPLALLLSLARGRPEPWLAIATEATRRFSVIGIISVATLIASGSVNSWFLVGSLKALADTEYGRVLISKLVLFAVMLAIAAINRNVLTPRLAAAAAEQRAAAQRTLVRHCIYETALGFGVISIASWLGTLHPAAHFMN